MFCTHCGVEIPGDASYCSRCGQETGAGKERRNRGESAPKRLYRLPNDSKIAGVCAGLARYIDVDVTLVRILTVVTACITGFVPGIIAYLVVWMIMPVDYGRTHAAQPAKPAPTSAG